MVPECEVVTCSPFDKTTLGKSDVEVCEPICSTTAGWFLLKFL